MPYHRFACLFALVAARSCVCALVLRYFWQQVSSEVLPQLEGKTVGVWQSDKLEIDPKLLPSGSFGNVWQSPKKMADVIDAGMPVVLSGTWYLDQENPETAAGPCMEYAWQQTWKCMYVRVPDSAPSLLRCEAPILETRRV